MTLKIKVCKYRESRIINKVSRISSEPPYWCNLRAVVFNFPVSLAMISLFELLSPLYRIRRIRNDPGVGYIRFVKNRALEIHEHALFIVEYNATRIIECHTSVFERNKERTTWNEIYKSSHCLLIAHLQEILTNKPIRFSFYRIA